jgi:hypothetical protein
MENGNESGSLLSTPQNLLGLLEQVETKAKKSEEDTDKVGSTLASIT